MKKTRYSDEQIVRILRETDKDTIVKWSAKVHHKLGSVFKPVRVITRFNNIAMMNKPYRASRDCSIERTFTASHDGYGRCVNYSGPTNCFGSEKLGQFLAAVY